MFILSLFISFLFNTLIYKIKNYLIFILEDIIINKIKGYFIFILKNIMLKFNLLNITKSMLSNFFINKIKYAYFSLLFILILTYLLYIYNPILFNMHIIYHIFIICIFLFLGLIASILFFYINYINFSFKNKHPFLHMFVNLICIAVFLYCIGSILLSVYTILEEIYEISQGIIDKLLYYIYKMMVWPTQNPGNSGENHGPSTAGGGGKPPGKGPNDLPNKGGTDKPDRQDSEDDSEVSGDYCFFSEHSSDSESDLNERANEVFSMLRKQSKEKKLEEKKIRADLENERKRSLIRNSRRRNRRNKYATESTEERAIRLEKAKVAFKKNYTDKKRKGDDSNN